MSKITNKGPVCHRMHYSCTHMTTVGVKGLNNPTDAMYLCCGTSHRAVRRRPSGRWRGQHAWCCRVVCRWAADVVQADTARRWHSVVERTTTPDSECTHSPAPKRCRGHHAADDMAPPTSAPGVTTIIYIYNLKKIIYTVLPVDSSKRNGFQPSSSSFMASTTRSA